MTNTINHEYVIDLLQKANVALTDLYAETGDEKLLQGLTYLENAKTSVRISWLYRDVILSKEGE